MNYPYSPEPVAESSEPICLDGRQIGYVEWDGYCQAVLQARGSDIAKRAPACIKWIPREEV